jgi:uncharacterized protein YeeX (DUF496 family)
MAEMTLSFEFNYLTSEKYLKLFLIRVLTFIRGMRRKNTISKTVQSNEAVIFNGFLPFTIGEKLILYLKIVAVKEKIMYT